MNKLKFALRIIGAIIVPTFIFGATERLFPLLYDTWLLQIWTYNGESVLGLLASGSAAGSLFVLATYYIAPKWKTAITITMSSIMAALLIMSIIILCAMPKGLNWLHIIHTCFAIISLITGMVIIFEQGKENNV